MAAVSKNRYVLEINGIPQFFAQKITPPKRSYDQLEFSEGKKMKKMPAGSYKVSDMTVEGLVTNLQSDSFAQNLIKKLEAGVAPVQLMEFGRLVILAPNFVTPQAIYELEDVWLKEDGLGELDGKSSDLLTKTLIFSVGDIKQVL